MKIVEQIDATSQDAARSNDMIQFRSQNSDATVEEVIAYNELLERLESKDGDNDIWKFTSISGHEGPLKPSDSKYKGSRWNVKVEWSNGETSWEPLGIIATSDPVTCAIYAKQNSLLGLEGWRQFKRLAKRQKKFVRMVHQTKLHSF